MQASIFFVYIFFRTMMLLVGYRKDIILVCKILVAATLEIWLVVLVAAAVAE